MSTPLQKSAGKPSAKTIYIHRAPWIVPVDCTLDSLIAEKKTAAPFLVPNGAICIQGDTILDVGSFDSLAKGFAGAHIIDHESCVLTPGLVNAHAHLELSYLSIKDADIPWESGIVSWIRKLVANREALETGKDEIHQAGRRALDYLYQRGVGLICDIGNEYMSRNIADGSKGSVLFFLELMGISRKSSSAALDFMKKQENDLRVTVHAPYSCDIHLITAVKKRANRLHHLFPVHVAESRSEIEFLHTGKGEIHDFLVERGTWDDSFTPVSDKTAGSVLYLDRLGVLDERTLCVHAIHISQEEMDLLAKRKAKVCVCPGSNRYLGVGKAPVPDFLERGIVPALGTDSLTSNPQLDMWQEMKTLAQDHPGIDPAVIFAMATRGGAEALQNGESFGKLAPGMPANILEVKVGNLGQREVLDFLVTRGIDIMSKWVSVEGSL